jgi:fibronectin-binding autotransporter adhesin
VKRRIGTASLSWLSLFVAIGVLACADSHATTYYWDTNGANSGIGSAGGAAADWLTDSWATGSTGTLPTAAWPNTEPDNDDEAVFMGTAGTVQLGSGVHVNALRFQTNGYQIASTGGVLHLDGANRTINVTLPSNNNTATISAPITGNNGFTLTGNSTLSPGSLDRKRGSGSEKGTFYFSWNRKRDRKRESDRKAPSNSKCNISAVSPVLEDFAGSAIVESFARAIIQ